MRDVGIQVDALPAAIASRGHAGAGAGAAGFESRTFDAACAAADVARGEVRATRVTGFLAFRTAETRARDARSACWADRAAAAAVVGIREEVDASIVAGGVPLRGADTDAVRARSVGRTDISARAAVLIGDGNALQGAEKLAVGTAVGGISAANAGAAAHGSAAAHGTVVRSAVAGSTPTRCRRARTAAGLNVSLVALRVLRGFRAADRD